MEWSILLLLNTLFNIGLSIVIVIVVVRLIKRIITFSNEVKETHKNTNEILDKLEKKK